jgi:Ca2+-binding RTX toxin-like protein
VIGRARNLMMAAVGALALSACQGEPGSIAGPVARLSVLSMAGDDGHEEPDPSVPPICHGDTATIWATMPAALIPIGASIRPAVRGDEDHLIAAGDDGGDDEVSGYVISGTNGRDVIVGSPQRDSISGNSGDDVVCADSAHAEDEAGHGEDALAGSDEGGGAAGQGGGGPDKVWGGNGNDTIYGGGGPDSLYGGNGQDVMYGGGGPDAMFGENGDDTLYGGPGPDFLSGGNGDDWLYGDVSNDVLLGEHGDDHLFGGGGDDTLDGGAGANEIDPGDQGGSAESPVRATDAITPFPA